jgi:acyl-CoA hydrolase
MTAYVGNVRFSRPVKVGDLVEATAQLIHTGRSSMHILVTVRSGNTRDQLLTEATKCLMIFVAMGPDSRSTPVPPWQPITDEDREQQASAQRRIALRADIESAMASQQHTEKGTAPLVDLLVPLQNRGTAGPRPPRVDGFL